MIRKVLTGCTVILVCMTGVFADGDPDELSSFKAVADSLPENQALQTGRVAATGNKPTDIKTVQQISLYASDKSTQLSFQRQHTRPVSYQGQLTYSLLISEERDNVFAAAWVIPAKNLFPDSLLVSAGVKGIAGLLAIENLDIFGLAVGAEAQYSIRTPQFPLELDASLYYAPDIFSFGQANRIFDTQINAGIRIRESVTTYIGHRLLYFDTRPQSRDVDDMVHIGVRWLY